MIVFKLFTSHRSIRLTGVTQQTARCICLTISLLSLCALTPARADEPTGSPAVHSPQTSSTLPPLQRSVSLSASDTPLKKALESLCQQAGIPLDFNAAELKPYQLTAETPVTVEVDKLPLEAALRRIIVALYNAPLGYEVQDGKLHISSSPAIRKRQAQHLPDWLLPLQDNGLLATMDEDHNVIRVSVGEHATNDFLAKLKTLKKLRSLNISTSKSISPGGLAHLADLPQLEDLSLYHINIDDLLGDEALKVAARIKSLRKLSVNECGVTDAGMRHLESMTELTELSLGHNRITEIGLNSLARLKKLRLLELNGYPSIQSDMSAITDDGLQQLSELQNLEMLGLSGLKVSGANLKFPKLKELHLTGQQVNDAALEKIAAHQNLRVLGLPFTSVTDRGMEHVARLRDLRRISLAGDFITDAGVAHLKGLQRLESIELRLSKVSDKSLEHLAAIKSLTRVDLYGRTMPSLNAGRIFTSAGLLQLKNLPRLDTLYISLLALDGNVELFREFPHLRELSLDMCNTSAADVERLEDALPNTQVYGGGPGKIMRTPRWARPRKPKPQR